VNKRLLLVFMISLIFPVTVLAAETAVWGWQRGVDSCAQWSAGCTGNGYALIPKAPAWSTITVTAGCDSVTIARAETRSSVPPRIYINGAPPPVLSVTAGSRISIQAVAAVTDGLDSLTLSCASVPALDDMQPIPFDPNRRTAIADMETLDVVDVFNMGRYALTYWSFIGKVDYLPEIIIALLLVPLALTVIYRRLRRPPEI